MTRKYGLPVGIIKELRGLFLPWLACLVPMIGSVAIGRWMFVDVGIVAYFLGAACLGAFSMGQEYGHRTLPMLLVQPVRRTRLLLTKLAVLAVLLLILSAVAAAFVFDAGSSVRDFQPRGARLAALFLPVLGGLFLSPWLTMIFRSPIAGAVFALEVPGLLWLVGESLGIAIFGYTHKVDDFRYAFFVWGMVGSCAIAAIMGWRTFQRLEVPDSRGESLDVPRRRSSSGVTTVTTLRRRHPMWLLVTKELRLQSMPLTIAALHVIGWIAARLLVGVLPRIPEIVYVLTFFYSVLVSLLIGSHASAEERQLGTLEWQVLLPVGTSTQWVLKAAVALALSLLLGVALPMVLAYIDPMQPAEFTGPTHLVWAHTILAILMTTSGLYFSSFSTSGLRALLVSLPGMFGAGVLLRVLIGWSGPAAQAAFARLFLLPTPFGSEAGWLDARIMIALTLVLLAALLVLVLRFAHANHRAADRGAREVWRQMMWLTASLAIAVTLVSALA